MLARLIRSTWAGGTGRTTERCAGEVRWMERPASSESDLNAFQSCQTAWAVDGSISLSSIQPNYNSISEACSYFANISYPDTCRNIFKYQLISHQKPPSHPIMINQSNNNTSTKCVLLLLLVLCISTSSSHAHPSLRNGSKVDLRTIDENYQHPMIRRKPSLTSTEQEEDEHRLLSSSAKTTTPVNKLRGGILKNSSITTNNSRSEAHQNLRGGASDTLRLSTYGSAPYVKSSSSADTSSNESGHLRSRSCAFCRSGQQCPYVVATKASDSTHSHNEL